MLNGILERNCYNETLDPQASVEFNLCLRTFHYFLRAQMSTYNESLFAVSGGLRRQKPINRDFSQYVDNLSFVDENRCGLRHGLLDKNWNIGRLDEEISCRFFAPNETSLGHDIRSMDYQFARITGEPRYIDVLKGLYGVEKCDTEITKEDFINHSPEIRDILFDRVDDRPEDIGFTMGVDFESKNGDVLAPTCSRIIREQLFRSYCGDRFYFSNADFFTDGKISKIKILSIFSKPILFTAQKDAITRFELRDIFCITNGPCNNTKMQDDCMSSPGSDNLKKPCLSIAEHLAGFQLDTWIP